MYEDDELEETPRLLFLMGLRIDAEDALPELRLQYFIFALFAATSAN